MKGGGRESEMVVLNHSGRGWRGGIVAEEGYELRCGGVGGRGGGGGGVGWFFFFKQKTAYEIGL